mgnify:FL=1
MLEYLGGLEQRNGPPADSNAVLDAAEVDALEAL